MDVILVQTELIGRQNPTLLAPVAQGSGPFWRPYYLVGPLPGRDAGEDEIDARALAALLTGLQTAAEPAPAG